MDTVEKIEEYLESLEEYFFSSLAAATTDLPNVHEAVNRLWVDISRYGPGIPAFPMHLPNLGDFQVPPPPPPPPPPPHAHLTWLSNSADWAGRHPWTASGIAVGAVGAGLLVGYRVIDTRKKGKCRIKSQSNERRQVVVVLGGDSPLGLPLILDLEKKGYIVITSVSTPEAVRILEHKCQGYVRALVLDPDEPGTIHVFLRSLASTLARRFPVTAAGDPFASPSSHPYIHSVISLLTLPTSTPSIHAPLEHISLRNAYLPYLNATHITPLQVIQALLPLLRTAPARARDKGKKSIIVCLPAMEASVGLPFASMQAMSAASTLRGVEVLRREINVAALTDRSESMKNIQVVVVDIGSFSIGSSPSTFSPENVYKAMEEWSPSEKLTYGPAFVSIAHDPPTPASSWGALSSVFKNGHRYGVPRTPTDVDVFVNNLISVVTGGRDGPSLFGFGLGMGRIRNWMRGERFAIGAGATTYRFASYLSPLVLDTLLSIPYLLISIRNRLLPVEPFVRPPGTLCSLPAASDTAAAPLPSSSEISSQSEGDDESGNDPYETNSEVDVESNSGDGAGSSWVSLSARTGEARAESV